MLLEPRTQVLLDSAAAPANLFIEASSPEDAEFWLKVPTDGGAVIQQVVAGAELGCRC